jgi:hypothetical protein
MTRFGSMLDTTWQGIVHRPRRVLLGLLVITLFFFYQLAVRGLPLDNSPNSLLVSRDQALSQYNEAIATFGDDRVMILTLVADDIFTPDAIAQLRALTRRVERLPGVAQAISLTNVQSGRSSGDSLRVGTLIPATASAADLQHIAHEVEQNQFIVGNLVSRDRNMAAINIFFSTGRGEAEKKAVAEIERMVKSEFGGSEIYFAGLPYMEHRNDVHVTRDLMTFAPLTVLLIFVTFYFAFRTWRGVVMPLATVAVGLIWTFGVMALMGKPLTLITMMLPVIIMAIGSSYVIHVINQYYISTLSLGHDPSREERRAAVLHALRFIGPPVIVSGTTTMAGFGSLAFTTIVGMRDMGIYNAVGTGFTMLLALTLVPAWLILLKPSAPVETGRQPRVRYVGELLDRIATLVTRRQPWVYSVVLVTTLAAVVGIERLSINSDFLAFYPEGSEERVGAEKLHEHLGGAAAFRIIVKGPRPQALHDAAALKRLVELQRFVETLPGVDRTISIADMVKLTNRLLRSGEPRDEVIPPDQTSLDEIFSHLTASGDETPIRFISDDGSQAQVMVRSHLFGSNEMDETLRRITAWGQARLPSGFTAYPTGIFVLLNRTSDSVAAQQARSLVIALVLIFIMMALLFRSVKVGAVALLPNVIPIVAFFGFMGWTSIPLNLNTSLVASIVLGLAVDNAAHLVRRYRQCCLELSDKQQAVRRSLQQTGRPMVFANLTLVFAFAIFALSAFLPVRTGGLLSAVTILACLISDLMFLPVLMNSRWLQVGGEPIPRASVAKTVSAAVTEEEQKNVRLMRSPRFILALILSGCALSFQACQRDHGATTPEAKPLPTGEEVVNRYLAYDDCHNAKLTIKAHLTEADGTEREFIIMNYQKCVAGAQYTLRQVAAPASERARALLSIERPGQPVENVAYLPGFDKFVEVQDLTKEDTLFGLSVQESLGGYDLYDYTMLGAERLDQHETYKVEGQLQPEATSRFVRTLTYFRQDNFLPVRMELYNSLGELVRIRRYTDWAQINGRWTERRTEVDNLKHQKRIVFETVEADYEADWPLSFFSRENLKALITSQR